MKSTQQHIYIFDHPESRIRFLETTLAGQDWRATIVVPPAQTANPVAYATALEKEFSDKGYSTSQSVDADGTVNLYLHHFSGSTSPLDVVHEMGLVKGTSFAIRNIGHSASHVVSSAMNMVAYTVKEPARLLSAAYLTGEAMYSFAGAVERGTEKKAENRTRLQKIRDGAAKLKQPENFLMSSMGLFSLAQSLTFLLYAENGGELNYKRLKAQFETGEKNGIDSTNVQGWTAPKNYQPLLGSFDEIGRKYPIELGSWAQILGQFSLIGASTIQVRKSFGEAKHYLHGTSGTLPQKAWSTLRSPLTAQNMAAKDTLGAGINVLRSMLSITGWLTFMHTPSDKPVTAGWDHPIDRVRQVIGHHPEYAASFFTASASVVGIIASHLKGNKATLGAEIVWLVGDGIMLFTSKENYGEMAAGHEQPLIDASTRFLLQLPIAVSEAKKAQLITDLADYLANKTVSEKKGGEKAHSANEVATLKDAIIAGVTANMKMQNTVFNRLTEAASSLVERFPIKERNEVMHTLCRGLSTSPGIYASEQELCDAISKRADLASDFGHAPPSMESLARPIAQLITASPVIANAGAAVAAYDAIANHIQKSSNDKKLFDQAVAQHGYAQMAAAPQTFQEKISAQHGATSAQALA